MQTLYSVQVHEIQAICFVPTDWKNVKAYLPTNRKLKAIVCKLLSQVIDKRLSYFVNLEKIRGIVYCFIAIYSLASFSSAGPWRRGAVEPTDS